MNSKKTGNPIPSDLLAWRQILSLFEEGKLREKLKEMPHEALLYASDEQNELSLVNSMIATLQQIDPDKANVEYAAKVVGMMRRISLYLLSEIKET